MARKKPDQAERSRRLTIVLCLCASLGFWLIIKLSATYTTLEPIEIDYRLPQNLAFGQPPPTMLEASVSASGWELLGQQFSAAQRRIVIDSADIGANPDGIISIRRAVAQAFAGEGLTVDAMTDERVVLQMERVNVKRVPVRLVAKVGYAGGFRSSHAPKLSPDSVSLSGPASVLDTIASWPTDTLLLQQVVDTVRAVALVHVPSNAALRVTPSQVEVLVESQQFTEKRLYIPVRVEGRDRRDSVALFPNQVLVSFPVGLRDYDRVSSDDFRAVVDVSQVTLRSATSLPVTIVEQPSGIGKPTVQPRTVEVFLHTERVLEDQ